MGGHAKDEESAWKAAVAMGWFDEHYRWTPEKPAPPGIAELIGLNRPKYDKIVFSESVKDAVEAAGDPWRSFREKGGKIVNADTGEVIAIVDPAQPAEDDSFVANLRIPEPTHCHADGHGPCKADDCPIAGLGPLRGHLRPCPGAPEPQHGAVS